MPNRNDALLIFHKDILLSMALDALLDANWYMLTTLTAEQLIDNKKLANIGDVIRAIKKELLKEHE